MGGYAGHALNIKRILLVISPLLVLFAVLGVVGYFWWQTTPYYAFQQIGTAALNSDSTTFKKYVDVQNLVSSFTEEVFFEPARNTPDLSTFQKEIGLGAIEMARGPLDRALVGGIERWVATPKQKASVSRDQNEFERARRLEQFLGQRLAADHSNLILCGYESDTIADFTNTLKTELQSDAGKLKQQTYRRMHEYASAHPEALINKIFSASAQNRGTVIKEVVAQLGLDAKNFRGISSYESFGNQICDVRFYSPKVSRVVTLSIEMIQQNADGLLVPLKVSKLVAVKRTLMELGEDSEKQVQALVAYGLQDVTTKNALHGTGNALKRLGKQESTQRFLKQILQKARQGI